ncbi:MAG: 30S ribosomal protein S7 [Thermoplasmatota archaeon]
MADPETNEENTGAGNGNGSEGASVLEKVAIQEAAPPSRAGFNFLVFEKWPSTGITIRDPGLARYINLTPVAVLHTGARHANRPFAKRHVHLVERLVNHVMRTENWTGKKASAYRAVREAFEIVATKTKDNPVQVLVRAIENAAPREEVTRLRYGGISVPKAVDVAPSRRVDLAIRLMMTGAVHASHKSKNPIAACIADEILKAAKGDLNSYAVGKKEEVERVAKSAR